LTPRGIFVLSLTVPFGDEDKEWLKEVHRVKQPLLKQFLTEQDLKQELKNAGFVVETMRQLQVQESINRWMGHAPELGQEVQKKVIDMVAKAPAAYRKLHRVKVIGTEVLEDWHWVVLKAVKLKD
jgi:hypothetical protein